MKGTASVPSFSFQGSNKTGWYLSNTNEMSAAINGVQYVTISSSGAISNATWNGTAVSAIYGGTGQTAYTTGDLLYASATNTVSKLPIGTTGYFLGIQAGVPTWLPVGTPGSVASFSGGTTGLTPNTPTIGAITLAGTLATANGGTGVTSFTAGGAFYATSTSALTTGTLPTASGGTGLTSFTSGGAVYASSTSALTTGTLPATAGGTGLNSYTTGDILYATSASVVGKLADVAVGNVLLSGGVGAAPTYGKVDLTTTVTGTLPVANGGTGLSSTPANGQIDIGNGTGFTRATLTAGAGISINNTVGSVTITCTVAVGAQGYVTQFLGPSGPPTFRSQGFGII